LVAVIHGFESSHRGHDTITHLEFECVQSAIEKLVVCVEKEYELSGCASETFVSRNGRTTRRGSTDDLDLRESSGHLCGVVAGAVVNDNDFARSIR
jgi:hypothetical protein